MTIYRLKPRFQALLRPIVRRLAAIGVTANQVTVAAALGSVILGLGLLAPETDPRWYVLLAPWLLARMALNAIDGMLAREHGQQSALGACLNEIGDVVSDLALWLPVLLWPGLDPRLAVAAGALIVLSEFAGLLGPAIGASRRYEGPMGKSDRALVLGVLGLVIAATGSLPIPSVLVGLIALLLAVTSVRRVRAALAEVAG